MKRSKEAHRDFKKMLLKLEDTSQAKQSRFEEDTNNKTLISYPEDKRENVESITGGQKRTKRENRQGGKTVTSIPRSALSLSNCS